MRDVFIAPLAAQHAVLQKELVATSYDAVLCDIGFTGVLPILLSAQQRPFVLVCGVGPLTVSSADTPPFGTGWQPQPGTDYRPMNWVVHHVFFGDIWAQLNRALRRLGAPASPVFLTDWPLLADRVLQFTVPQLEYPRRDLSSAVTFTGPVLPLQQSMKSTGTQWHHVADEASTLVHVTQGTWHNRDMDQLITPTLDALADRDGISVIATTGRPGCRLTVPPNATNTHVTDFVPYPQLLPHVDIMITNGGYGGIHQALAHGIPLIIAADDADKPEIAARIAYTGAGVDLGTARPSPAQISDAVHRVRNESRFTGAARSLGRHLNATRPLATIAAVLSDLPSLDAEPTQRAGSGPPRPRRRAR
jgi:hypothetical protein